MKTQRTHLLALRAASQVTAVSRAFRRVAVGTAASAMIITSAGGCSSTSSPGSPVDAAVSDDDVSARADVSSLLDTILGDDIASSDTGAADGSDGSDQADLSDVVSVVDVDGADMTDGSDAADSMDMTDGADNAELPDTCLIPNGKACTTSEDCNERDSWGSQCIEGECNDADFNSEEAQACCDAQYAAGNFGVPGCNPWGPPAPPIDRGYRLADLSDIVGIA